MSSNHTHKIQLLFTIKPLFFSLPYMGFYPKYPIYIIPLDKMDQLFFKDLIFFYVGLSFLEILGLFFLGGYVPSETEMKRSVEGLDGISFVDEEESKVKKLLNELLELQKDFVSKKRKLQAAKLKKESILAEILFLKRRRRYLLKSQSSHDDNEKNIHFDAESEVPKVERSNSGYDAVVESARPAFTSKFNSEHHEVGYEELSAGVDVLRMEFVPKNYLIDDNNRVGKKELSWHGQVTLKV